MRNSLAEHREVKDYGEVYKPVILFFALIDQMYVLCFGKHVTASEASDWTSALADWIRHNDDLVLRSMAKVLSTFQVNRPSVFVIRTHKFKNANLIYYRTIWYQRRQ